jgi:hypothetical protein
MDAINVNELEAAILKKRLKYLRAQGATGKRGTHGFGNDFFKRMEDQWTFCAVLADIYAVKEMLDQQRQEELSATLPSSVNEDWEEDDVDAEAKELYARLVVKHLVSGDDVDHQSDEPSDVSETK